MPAPGPAATAAVAGPLLYGGFWRRVLGAIVDGLIVGLVMMPIKLALGLANLGLALQDSLRPESIAAMIAAGLSFWLLSSIASWLYGAGFESSRWQATPGKMVVGVKVTDPEGRRISFARATGRQFGKWLSGLILCIGYLMVAFTEKKQGLHDMLAGTLVRRSA